MLDIDETEFEAVESRLKLAIDAIVLRHRSAGDVLTWRLLHTIEEEAFAEIKARGDLDPTIVRMLQSSPMFTFPRTDEPANFGDSNALPAAFYLTQQAYSHTH